MQKTPALLSFHDASHSSSAITGTLFAEAQQTVLGKVLFS